MTGNNTNTGLLMITGFCGLVAALLVGWGEFLLNFDNLARYSEVNYDFMLGITFLIALSGSGLELSQGGVCPVTSFQLPLCYVSLALCLAIMAFYLVARAAKL